MNKNKRIATGQKAAVADVLTLDKYSNLTSGDANFLFSKWKNSLRGSVRIKGEGITAAFGESLEKKDYLDRTSQYSDQPAYRLTGKGRQFVKAVKGRMDSRRNLKHNADLFPEYSNISDKERLEAIRKEIQRHITMPRDKVLQYAREINEFRKKSSRALDAASTSQRVLPPTFEGLIRWAKSPGRYDIAGVDAPEDAEPTVTPRVRDEEKKEKSFLSKLWNG